MKALGIDFGTATISAVVMNMDTQKLEKSYTVSNNSFLATSHVWENVQDPAVMITKAKKLVDSILEEYPEIARIEMCALQKQTWNVWVWIPGFFRRLQKSLR